MYVILRAIRSDERLTLETLALASVYGGHITLVAKLIKPNTFVSTPASTQHHIN